MSAWASLVNQNFFLRLGQKETSLEKNSEWFVPLEVVVYNKSQVERKHLESCIFTVERGGTIINDNYFTGANVLS